MPNLKKALYATKRKDLNENGILKIDIIIINLHEIKKHLILRIIHNVRIEERDEYI